MPLPYTGTSWCDPLFEARKPRQSGRKGSRKVRTGCVTCKVRKVKCDETKPNCLRCTNTGRKCDGYMPVWPGRGSIQRFVTPIRFETSEGRRAFDFYRMNSAHLLQGVFQEDFWDGVVLQLSLREPIVHHAVLAVSGLLEYVTSTEPMRDLAAQRDVALREYGKAIQRLLRWDAKSDTFAIPLLVCVLFICIEFLLRHDGPSQLHICQGRNMLLGLSEFRSSDLILIKHDLVPIYARLSLASFLFGSRPVPIPDHLTALRGSQPSFTSMAQARCHLYLLVDHALRFTARGQPAAYSPSPDMEELNDLAAEQQRLLTSLSDWRNAFAVFTASRKEASDTGQHLLQLYYTASVIWVSTALQPYETAYDAHTPAFASIVTDASAVLHSFCARSPLSLFTFETELIAPLYWAATKCRHPLLRRAAVRLLMRDELRNRRENMWSGKAAIAIAVKVIELEEECTGIDVPSHHHTLGSADDGFKLDIDDHLPSDERHSQNHLSANVQIPLSQPPTIPRDLLPIYDPVVVNVDGSPLSIASTTSTPDAPGDRKLLPPLSASQAIHLDPPYGITESQRIKNTLIEPQEAHGVWVRIFRDLKDDQKDWHISREFLPL